MSLLLRSTADETNSPDGAAADARLLALMQRVSDRSLHSAELAAHAADWHTQYHSSAARANLLRPFERRLRDRTLEVGAGYGTLTRYLGEIGGQVVALEADPCRAAITAARCAGLDNVTVSVESIGQLAAGRRFAAVTLVGALERASRRPASAVSAAQLLERAAMLLDDNGVVIVAVDNQLGLKYLAGWATDEPRMFELRELIALVAAAGCPHHAVYAAFPDYRFPRVIISPAGLDDPAWRDDLAAMVAATPVDDPQSPVVPLFSLEQALRVSARDGQLKALANSFLLVAGRHPSCIDDDPAILAWQFGREHQRDVHEIRNGRNNRAVAVDVWTTGLGAILNTPGWTAADLAGWTATALRVGRPDPFPGFEGEVPREIEPGHALFRGLLASLSQFRSVAPPGEGVPCRVLDLVSLAAAAVGTPISPSNESRYVAHEAELQHRLTGIPLAEARDALSRQRLVARPTLETLAGLTRQIESLTEINRQLAAGRDDLRDEVDRSWAAQEKAAERHAAEQEDLRHQLSESSRARATVEAALRTLEARGRQQHSRVEQTIRHARAEAEERTRRLAHAAGLAVAATAAHGRASSSRPRRLRQRLRDAGLPLGWIVWHPLGFVRRAARLLSKEYRVRLVELAESGIFDPAYYGTASGVGARADLVGRFILHGDAANEPPHPLFDPVWYRRQNPDVPDSTPPLLHYLRNGGREGRDPHPLFDTRHYLAQWPAGSVDAPALAHFLRVGFLGAASPHPLFDVAYYARQRPDLAGDRVNPLLHYLATAAAEQADPHPLFSTGFYLERNRDIGASNPLDHFVRHGGLEGRSPHPLFDIEFYWQQRPDVRALGVNALLHFLQSGAGEGTHPHPLFLTDFYLDQTAGLPEVGVNPLIHFLRWGWREGLRPNPWFDPTWYLEQHPDVAGLNPLVHFALHGWREMRDPSPEFSVSAYLARYPEVAASGLNPLEHYIRWGRAEGWRLPR